MRTLAGVPKLWDTTIDSHREAVRRATLDATAALIRAHGLSSASMSEIAKQAGIGRATLYKYFPDLDAILSAWHEREVSNHLAELAALRDQPGSADARLERVLLAYATLSRRGQGHGSDRAPLLHQGPHVARQGSTWWTSCASCSTSASRATPSGTTFRPWSWRTTACAR